MLEYQLPFLLVVQMHFTQCLQYCTENLSIAKTNLCGAFELLFTQSQFLFT